MLGAALSPRQVFVVDCFSSDGTQRIVEEWKSGGVISGGVGDWRSGGVSTAAEFRRRALEKVEEWLADVSEERSLRPEVNLDSRSKSEV